jgi:hypothetical protein
MVSCKANEVTSTTINITCAALDVSFLIWFFRQSWCRIGQSEEGRLEEASWNRKNADEVKRERMESENGRTQDVAWESDNSGYPERTSPIMIWLDTIAVVFYPLAIALPLCVACFTVYLLCSTTRGDNKIIRVTINWTILSDLHRNIR